MSPPTDFQPIVRLDRDGQRELTVMRWGLVPYWAKDSKIAFSTINAKSETVTTSPNVLRGDEAPALLGSCGMVL
jgi:putative SOS response-associated peptidase YedK